MRTRAPYVSSIVVGLVLLAAAAPVFAHAELATSSPEAGSTVTDVRAVTLTFTEALEGSESSFKLVGPDGRTMGTGAVASPKVMRLEGVSLVPGKYTVKWTAAATDGHIERGKFIFTVEASAVTPAPVTPAPATEAPVATDSPAASDAPSAAPTDALAETEGPATTPAPTEAPAASPASPSADPAAASSGMDIVFPIIGLVVIVAVVGALVLRRSRQA